MKMFVRLLVILGIFVLASAALWGAVTLVSGNREALAGVERSFDGDMHFGRDGGHHGPGEFVGGGRGGDHFEGGGHGRGGWFGLVGRVLLIAGIAAPVALVAGLVVRRRRRRRAAVFPAVGAPVASSPAVEAVTTPAAGEGSAVPVADAGAPVPPPDSEAGRPPA